MADKSISIHSKSNQAKSNQAKSDRAKSTDDDYPIRLHCQTMGTGPDLVILHGLFGNGENWRTQAQRLSQSFRVHSMDIRNHGESPHTAGMNYQQMAADVVETCRSLGISETHVLGHSMGGKTAMKLALDTPALVKKLIVVDIGPQQYPHHHTRIIEGMQHLQVSEITSRRAAEELLAPYVDNPGIRAFLLKNLKRTDNADYTLRVNLSAIAKHYDDIAAAITATTPHQGPTLFIKGENSDYLQRQDQPTVLGLFPQARLKMIAGAGHWPHSEKPDVVFKIITDFLLTG